MDKTKQPLSKVLSMKPTEADLGSSEFKELWNYIKSWEIKVPGDTVHDRGRPAGQHVMDILVAVGLRNSADYFKSDTE